MTILFVLGDLDTKRGGVYSCVRAISEALERLGVQVHVCGTSRSMDYFGWRVSATTALRRRGPTNVHFSADWSGYSMAFINKPDLVWVHGLWMFHAALLGEMAMARKVPVLISPHGSANRVALDIARLKKRISLFLFQRRHLERASAIHCLTLIEEAAVVQSVRPQRTIVLPSGVDIPFTSEGIVNAECDKVALFLGRIHPIKGLDLLLEAWRKIEAAREGWRLIVCGGIDPTAYEYGAEMIEVMRVLPCVEYVGEVDGDAKWRWLLTAAVVILPSRSEGLPMTAVEAMACGVPILATREANVSTIAPREAFIQCGASVASLSRGLRALMELPVPRRRAMGNALKTIHAKSLSWDVLGAKYVEMLESIVKV